ncbi:hypothetical protein IQ244_24455 [Nostoc sp. LEGE 06077]|uniref:hypothetical protein n=1 Tax=Nostoc sp. LEGE 06077 TaxID=915325 RepID=UPI00187F07AF|nr:hypothetical protein [Nostoc sp. LEGE 06077]MBE9209592.1 hypothetical protein [Nostoc sp. LEGE 06077]
MKLSQPSINDTILVALISGCAALGVALINKNSPQENISPNPTSTNLSTSPTAQCHSTIAHKVCIANLTVQINSNEPQQVRYGERLPLKTEDKLKLLNLTFCIPSEARLNKLEAKAYLFNNGIENYQNMLSTPSNFPINVGCHNISNFPQSWTIAAGQHTVIIPMIKTDGSYRVVDKSFYLNLDVGD